MSFSTKFEQMELRCIYRGLLPEYFSDNPNFFIIIIITWVSVWKYLFISLIGEGRLEWLLLAIDGVNCVETQTAGMEKLSPPISNELSNRKIEYFLVFACSLHDEVEARFFHHMWYTPHNLALMTGHVPHVISLPTGPKLPTEKLKEIHCCHH